MLKMDKETGKWYCNNIPLGKKGVLSAIENNGVLYKVMPECRNDDCWYNDRFLGTRYAVFKWTGQFYQQITKWYAHFNKASKEMKKIAGV